MVTFIEKHRDAYGVESICAVLPIAPSTFFQHARERRSPDLRSSRARRDERLHEDIHRVWSEHRELYGARKVWRQLRREGVVVARCTVERLMRKRGMVGAQTPSVRRTS